MNVEWFHVYGYEINLTNQYRFLSRVHTILIVGIFSYEKRRSGLPADRLFLPGHILHVGIVSARQEQLLLKTCVTQPITLPSET